MQRAMPSLLPLVVVAPLLTAGLALLAWRRHRLVRFASQVGAIVHLVAAVGLLADVSMHGPIAVGVGGWSAPFGIALVADGLAAMMVVITAILGLATVVYGVRGGEEADGAHLGIVGDEATDHALLHGLLFGVTGAFVAGDLFNLYVCFEILLIASFALLAQGPGKGVTAGALKYVVTNLLGSALFLLSIGLTYGAYGTLNLAELGLIVRSGADTSALLPIGMLLFVAFGLKSAMFPLFHWLVASYHTPAFAISALFAGLLTKVGVVAMMRMVSLFFPTPSLVHSVLLIAALLTMTLGVMGAAVQNEVRKILSFHIISQVGYMLLGIAIGTPAALAGAVLYTAHHIVVKANLFFAGGIIHRLGGSGELSRIGGLLRSRPWFAVLFLVPALSLAGVPPLSGFWAKLSVIGASFEADQTLAAAMALGVGVLTLYSVTKIWAQAFWKPSPAAAEAVVSPKLRARWIAPVAGLSLMTLAIGLYPEPLAAASERAASSLVDPSTYIDAVLGPQPPDMDPQVAEGGR